MPVASLFFSNSGLVPSIFCLEIIFLQLRSEVETLFRKVLSDLLAEPDCGPNNLMFGPKKLPSRISGQGRPSLAQKQLRSLARHKLVKLFDYSRDTREREQRFTWPEQYWRHSCNKRKSSAILPHGLHAFDTGAQRRSTGILT
jgi:hypothetical protein